MAIDFEVSYYLTSEGVKRIFRKLFDKDERYNRAFFKDITTPHKLRVYFNNTGTYIESVKEFYSVVKNKLYFTYRFSEDLHNRDVSSIKIFDDSDGKLLMDYTNNEIIDQALRTNHKNLQITYTVNQITQCMPGNSREIIAKSLGNYTNFKINTIFIGTGVPDLSGQSTKLTHQINAYKITTIWYQDNKAVRVKAYANDGTFVNNSVTELGLGFRNGSLDNLNVPMDSIFRLDDVSMTLCTLQSVQFARMSYAGRYAVEVTIYLV